MPSPTQPKPRATWDRERLLWVSERAPCGYRQRFHSWRVALRIAAGHRCPDPYPDLPAARAVRGVRERRNTSKRRSATP